VLLDMAVIRNMVLAVTVIAFAAGAIPEFQLRIGYVGATADGAAMGICRLCLGCLPGLCIEGDNLGPLGGGLDGFLSEEPADLPPPGHGNHIQHILTKEQEIVGEGNDAEEVIGEGKGHQIHQNNGQIHQCEQPGFYRYDEEQQNHFTRLCFYDTSVIPVTVPDIECSSIILEALACDSFNTVVPAYKEKILKSKFVRDEDSSQMMDIIMQHRVVDLGDTVFLDTIRNGFIKSAFLNNTRELASSIKSKEKMMQKNLEKMINNYTEPIE